MAHLSPLSLHELDSRHLLWLDKASSVSYYGESVRELLERTRDGELALWELVDEEAGGLAGTTLNRRPRGTELWIDFLVGRGFLRRADEVHRAFLELAARAGATYVSGVAVRPGLARLYERALKVPPRATIFTEELGNGT